MGADDTLDLARRIARILPEYADQGTVTRRELFQRVKGDHRFDTVAALDQPLEILIQHGYLKMEPTDMTRGGRKTERYRIRKCEWGA